MPDPPSSGGRKTQATQEIDSNAPPIPTRKRYKGQAHSSDSRQKSKEDNELLLIPPENLDFNSVQRIQSLASKYKQLFEQVDQEKGTLINQRHDLQLRYDEIQGKFETEKKRLQQRAQDSEVEVSNLKKQLVESKAEASMYQSALGKATNVRWGDEDSNNLVQLTKVITEIVNSLTEVTTVKGRDITIDDDAANELFQKYNCSTRISVKSWKPILAAALQRLIVETLFHELANYLNHSDPRSKPKPQHLRQPSQLQTQTQPQLQSQSQSQPQPQPQQQQQQPPPPPPPPPPPQPHQQQQQQQPPSSPINSQPDAQTQAHAIFANIKKDSPKRSSSLIVPKSYPQPVVIDHNNNLEAEIYLSMTQLVGLVNHLAEARTGTDDITKITPIKIRQQIYAVLGTRGFCKNNHPFIDQLTKKILDTLSRYRQIKNEERLADLKEHTTKLIREIVHLYFRLNAQEPVPDFKDFFEAGTPVQNNVMDGAWDDDLIDNLEVEICSFPLISVKSSKDQSKRVLCKAQVVTRSKNN